MLRIGWVSPFSSDTGVGTFSFAVTEAFPDEVDGHTIDLTIVHPRSRQLYASRHRSLTIDRSANFEQTLHLFDILIFNIGNNRKHHADIFAIMRRFPGIVICHDFVYQHVLADYAHRNGKCFADFAALASLFSDGDGVQLLRRSRVACRDGHLRYTPWDNADCAQLPMSEAFCALGSALVVHSDFAGEQVRRHFHGPVLQLGMPCDQKPHNGKLVGSPTSPSNGELKRLVAFGHLQPTKCLDMVLDALSESEELKRCLQFTIAGNAPEASYLESLREKIKAGGLAASVAIEVAVSDSRLAELANAADAFVNLRRPNTEGASASLVEQLMFAKPVFVLASGCYAELPDDAAITLPADADASDIRDSLLRFARDAAGMREIGLAGQRWAQIWTCRRYAEDLLGFVRANQDLIRRRAQHPRAAAINMVPREDEAWWLQMAKARRALFYFDRHVLAVDPAFVLERSLADLCRHTAEIVLGLVPQPALLQAIEQLFAPLDATERYWRLCLLYFVAEAVFAGTSFAEQRSTAAAPYLDPALWAVLEYLPAEQLMKAASLLLLGQTMEGGTTKVSEDNDGFPRRLLLRPALSGLTAPGAERLRAWVAERRMPALAASLPVVDTRCEWHVGSSSFYGATYLSGFHPQEPDHVWVRGQVGFLGLRPGHSVKRVELLLQQLHAAPTSARTIRLSDGHQETQIELRSQQPCWLGLDLKSPIADPGVLWLELSTDYAAPPPGSADQRLLGIALFKIRVIAQADAPGLLPRSPARQAA